MSEQRHIVVVGSANADLAVEIDHRPAPGETILGSDLVVTPGGKGANQAVAAGLLGGSVAFVGCVGRDAYGDMLESSLRDAGVELSGLRRVDAPSGNALIMLTPDGENSIVVSPAANRQVTPELLDQVAGVLDGAGVIVAQLEIPMATIERLAERSGESRFVLNAAPAAELSGEVLRACDPLVVNETEALFLLGEGFDVEDPERLAKGLLELGVRSVVVTLGAKGALVAEGGEVTQVPAVKAEAVDTTGAGDSFVGALAVRLAEGAGLVEAARFAAKVAAVAVTRSGAQASYPTRAELQAADC